MFHVEPKTTDLLLAKTKDYLVSEEHFEVYLDPTTQIAQTHPAPAVDKLAQYYASDAYISHGNQKRTIIDRLYAWVQQLMFKQKEQWLSKHTKEKKRYLDFGCGTGALVHHLNHQNWEAYGVEPNDKARSLSPSQKQLYADLSQLPESNFDMIALWHVLEHLPDPEETLKKLSNQLNTTGHLFLALPNFNSFDAKYYKDFWAAYDVPRHLWHFSSTGITQLCNKIGFELVESKGMPFDAFYVSYLSEQHQKNSLPFFRALGVGLWSNLKACYTEEFSSKVYVFKKKA